MSQTLSTASDITPSPNSRDRGATAFRVAGVLVLLAILTGPAGVLDLLGPWTLLRDAEPGFTPELHRWHQADISALVSLIACGSLLVSLRKPRQHPLAVQVVVLTALLLALSSLVPLNVEALVPSLGVVVLLVAAYPDRAALVRFARPRLRSPLMLAALATVPPLVWNAADNLSRQLGDSGQHADLSHWIGSAVVAVGLICAGVLAATRQPGSRSLAGVVAIAYAYLGAAALTIPRHDGSWGRVGGVAALLAAAAFTAAVWSEPRESS